MPKAATNYWSDKLEERSHCRCFWDDHDHTNIVLIFFLCLHLSTSGLMVMIRMWTRATGKPPWSWNWRFHISIILAFISLIHIIHISINDILTTSSSTSWAPLSFSLHLNRHQEHYCQSQFRWLPSPRRPQSNWNKRLASNMSFYRCGMIGEAGFQTYF